MNRRGAQPASRKKVGDRRNDYWASGTPGAVWFDVGAVSFEVGAVCAGCCWFAGASGATWLTSDVSTFAGSREAPAIAARTIDKVMNSPPRPSHEGAITGRMWAGIVLVGVIMAAGTLLVLDAALPGGLIEGSGTIRYAQTMAFTTLVLFQLFNVFNARSDERSAFNSLLANPWLWAAIILSLLLQIAAVYVPFLQQAFSTVSLSAGDWLVCAAAASSVLWLRELSKILTRALWPEPAR